MRNLGQIRLKVKNTLQIAARKIWGKVTSHRIADLSLTKIGMMVGVPASEKLAEMRIRRKTVITLNTSVAIELTI